MGIKGLIPFLQEVAPKAIQKKHDVKVYSGRKIAVDASMCLYQFLIAIRTGEGESYGTLTNEAGETTSHILGFLTRTLKLLENGVRPVYVFDGKPPELKKGELAARREKRGEELKNLEEAKKSGDNEAIKKASDRTVVGTWQQVEEVKKLLRLMGCPIVEAPSEAEATCAQLNKAGLVYATATEDADALTFGTPKLIRNLFATDHKKRPILEVNSALMLRLLDIPMEQFIEFCILCGCDYTNTIKGVGQKTAFKLLKQNGNMETLLQNLPAKNTIPENFFWKESKQLFVKPEVTDTTDPNLKMGFKKPDYEGLKAFLIDECNFAPDRVDKHCAKLQAVRSAPVQLSILQFTTSEPEPHIAQEDIYNPFKKIERGPTVGGKKRKGILTASSLAKKQKQNSAKAPDIPESESEDDDQDNKSDHSGSLKPPRKRTPSPPSTSMFHSQPNHYPSSSQEPNYLKSPPSSLLSDAFKNTLSEEKSMNTAPSRLASSLLSDAFKNTLSEEKSNQITTSRPGSSLLSDTCNVSSQEIVKDTADRSKTLLLPTAETSTPPPSALLSDAFKTPPPSSLLSNAFNTPPPSSLLSDAFNTPPNKKSKIICDTPPPTTFEEAHSFAPPKKASIFDKMKSQEASDPKSSDPPAKKASIFDKMKAQEASDPKSSDPPTKKASIFDKMKAQEASDPKSSDPPAKKASIFDKMKSQEASDPKSSDPPTKKVSIFDKIKLEDTTKKRRKITPKKEIIMLDDDSDLEVPKDKKKVQKVIYLDSDSD